MNVDFDLAQDGKVAITVAPTSGIQGREASLYLPETPGEIAAEVSRARDAGASVAHIHVRDRHGHFTTDPAVYGEVIHRIRDCCDILIQLDNVVGVKIEPDGKVGTWSAESRMRLLGVHPKPDTIAIVAGTYTSTAGDLGERTVSNGPSFVKSFAAGCLSRGIGVEFEVFDLSQVHTVVAVAKEMGIRAPINWSFILRGGTNLPPRADHLLYLLQHIPPLSVWQAVGVGRHQLPLAVISLTLGNRVRVGMEDNLYYARGILAKSNAELVDRIVRMVREFGREIASPDETRIMLGLANNKEVIVENA